MRLTLRTLLAWRDGLLSGGEHEELSARVSPGSVAQGLLDRMQSLEKRTDVDVPKVEGRGLAADANSVAEYLENVLPADSLEAFERICLESDRHLAEVSECHAMLAEASAARSRAAGPQDLLVSAVATRLAGGVAEVAVQAAGGEVGPRQPVAPRSRKLPTPTDSVLPAEEIRLAEEPASQSASSRARRNATPRSPWLQVAAAVGLLCLVGGGLGVVLWWNPAAPPAGDPTSVAVQEPPAVPEPAVEAGNAPAAAPPVAPAESGGGNTELVGESEVATDDAPMVAATEPPAASEQAEAAPSAVASAASPEPPLGVGPSVPMGDALAIAAPPAPAPPPAVPPVPAPPQPTADASAPVGVLASGPLVLVADGTQPGTWRGVFPGESLAAGEQVLAPPAAMPELDLGGVVVRLAPRSQLVLRGHDEGSGGSVDVEIVFGAAIVRRLSGDRAVTLRAGRLLWQLTGPPSAVVAEVALVRSPGADPVAGSLATARISPLETEVSWQPLANAATPAGMPEGGVLPADTGVSWSSAQGQEATLVPAGNDPGAVLEPSDRLATAAVAVLAEAVRGQGSVVEAARGLAAARRVEHREVAAGTLALIGDYSAAVTLLAEDAPGDRLGDRRWRAFEQQVIPLAVARGENSAQRLRQAWAAQLPEKEAERVFQLALGLSDAQLAAGGDAELVAALNDPQLVIRRYAAWRLEEIVAATARDRLRYRADASAELRTEGMRWWAAQLEKGLIQRAKPGQLSGPDAG